VYFSIHVIVIFDSGVGELQGRMLMIVPIDPIDNTLAVTVDCDSIKVCQLQAGKVISVMLQE